MGYLVQYRIDVDKKDSRMPEQYYHPLKHFDVKDRALALDMAMRHRDKLQQDFPEARHIFLEEFWDSD